MKHDHDQQRRRLLQTIGLSAFTPLLPGLSIAASGTGLQNRFVFVILRGAMDGLAAVQPYGDAHLNGLRQSLMTPENSLRKLDSYFGLHPALENFADLYSDSELGIYHAIATPYRERSHFDGQNVLETGGNSPDQGMSGWLNRAVPYLSGANDTTVMGIGQTTPKVLYGKNETGNWAPAVLPAPTESTVSRLMRLYKQDPFLGERFSQGLMAQELATGMADTNGGRGRRQNFSELAKAAGKFLARDDGPVIAVLENNGWDTHANQGAQQGQLANKLTELDAGMMSLKDAMGSNWANTMVLVATEFGRTAAVNGTQGTDHGTASAAFLLGGAVKGKQVISDWPGLASGNLLDGRDLRPTLDIRQLAAVILHQHLGIAGSDIGSEILPGSGSINTSLLPT